MASVFDITPVAGTPPVEPGRSPRWLAFAVAATAVLVIAAGTALGISALHNRAGIGSPSRQTTHHATTPTTTRSSAPGLLNETTSSATGASYTVGASSFEVTVRASTHPAWVEMAPPSGPAAYAAVLAAGMSAHAAATSVLRVEIGAGGTTVTVSAGSHTQTLTPSVAPFTYTFSPR